MHCGGQAGSVGTEYFHGTGRPFRMGRPIGDFFDDACWMSNVGQPAQPRFHVAGHLRRVGSLPMSNVQTQ
jgi:hypothetical protein